MRLGLIYHQFIPRGGLEGYLMEFTTRLCAAGHEVHIVAAEASDVLAREIGVTLHRVPLMKGSPMLRMWQFNSAAARMAGELPVDVTIGFGRTTTHDLHRAGGGCHRVYSELLPPWKRWHPKNLLELRLEKELYTAGRTKLFVVNSSQVAKQLHEAYGTDERSFRVIHTAVDTARFKPVEDRATVRAKVCAQLKTDPARPAFLFVSLSHRRKGLDVLLDIWNEVDADLWIVGQNLDFSQRLKINRHGLQSKLRVIGAQSQVQALYASADWFIHPTLYDACANTVLQSMSCGLPGIVSVNDGAIDLLRDGENGFLLSHPRDPVSVLTVVRKALAAGEVTRKAMGLAARQTMLPLTWDAHLDKWFDVIAGLKP
ncbi:MAG: glycosyltransferase family 4 protein [Verrucomicrobiaceae bacterium]